MPLTDLAVRNAKVTGKQQRMSFSPYPELSLLEARRLRKLSIYEVTRGHLLEVIQKIEGRKSLSVAHKTRTWLAQKFRFAMVVVPDLEKNLATDLDVVAVPLPSVEHNPFLRMA